MEPMTIKTHSKTAFMHYRLTSELKSSVQEAMHNITLALAKCGDSELHTVVNNVGIKYNVQHDKHTLTLCILNVHTLKVVDKVFSIVVHPHEAHTIDIAFVVGKLAGCCNEYYFLRHQLVSLAQTVAQVTPSRNTNNQLRQFASS